MTQDRALKEKEKLMIREPVSDRRTEAGGGRVSARCICQVGEKGYGYDTPEAIECPVHGTEYAECVKCTWRDDPRRTTCPIENCGGQMQILKGGPVGQRLADTLSQLEAVQAERDRYREELKNLIAAIEKHQTSNQNSGLRNRDLYNAAALARIARSALEGGE